MSWHPAWETIFSTREWGRYPPEELIRFVARNYYGRDRGSVRFLELGCGPGPHVWYLAREGFDVTGIDGSPTAIEQARNRLTADGLDARLEVGDFVELEQQFADERFDVVVDVTALQHNRLPEVRTVVEQAHRLLAEDGRMFALMVSAGSWGDGLGTRLADGTYTDIPEGPLAGTGLVHFFTREEIDEDVFAPFSSVEVDYSRRSIGGGAHAYQHWIVQAAR
jgi:SAM-dependent methyltransferase